MFCIHVLKPRANFRNWFQTDSKQPLFSHIVSFASIKSIVKIESIEATLPTKEPEREKNLPFRLRSDLSLIIPFPIIKGQLIPALVQLFCWCYVDS
jgi:hypothetical protein